MYSYLSQARSSLQRLNALGQDTIESTLGLRFTALGPDFICAEMPVDSRTRQPYGLLHGGASVVMAESLGSMGSGLLVSDEEDAFVTGIEVSGSHMHPARNGKVTGIARPLRVGRTIHFWRIEIFNEAGRMCCAAKLTVNVARRGDRVSRS